LHGDRTSGNPGFHADIRHRAHRYPGLNEV
jgi:hypothetical protein